jgi:O-glycosyl hydrolase
LAGPHRATKRQYAVILLLATISLAALYCILTLKHSAITIEWNSPRQVIDGFGASVTGYNEAFTSARADEFFSAQTGLGLSLLRIRVIPDTIDEDCGCVSNSTPYYCVVGPKVQIVSGDLDIAKLAAERGVTLFAAAWSPPGAMKSSGRYCSKGAMKGTPANYADYAAALATFPDLLKKNGISLFAMSLQNEPNIEDAAYDTCSWSAEQIHDFVPYLWNTLHASGFGSIRLAIPEESGWKFDLLDRSMEDPAVASKIGLVMGHAYGRERPADIPPTNGLPIWQTEVSNTYRYDGSMRDGIVWARYLHNYMSAGTNAWMYWSLDCGFRYYNHDTNECLTDQHGNFAKRAFVLGQYAKFVRPGWHRVDVRNDGKLLVTAYRGPEREFAIVVVNDRRLPVHKQTFVLNGIVSQRSQVTPWLTSASDSLSARPPVSLISSGTVFSYSIPARSVVTFRGQAD